MKAALQAVLILHAFSTASSYVIHSSCSPYPWLKNVIDHAFDSVNNAIEIGDQALSSGNFQKVEQLLPAIFGVSKDNTALASAARDVRTMLGNVLIMSGMRGSQADSAAQIQDILDNRRFSEVIFFCGAGRFQKTNKAYRYQDTVLNGYMTWGGNPDAEIARCNSDAPLQKQDAEAFTSRIQERDDQDPANDPVTMRPNAITLCKGWLRYAPQDPLKDAIVDLMDAIAQPATLDLFRDYGDRLISHELFHTWTAERVTPGIPTQKAFIEDIQRPNSYGWVNVARLKHFGLYNAENWAYYVIGLVVKQFDYALNDDGTIPVQDSDSGSDSSSGSHSGSSSHSRTRSKLKFKFRS